MSVLHPLMESLALGVATLLLFLYGLAQRHLRKKTLEKIEAERLSAENRLYEAEQASKNTLIGIERDRDSVKEETKILRKACVDLAEQRDGLSEEIANLQVQKKDLLNFLKTEDGRTQMREAEEKLATLNKELEFRRSGRVISVFAYSKNSACATAYSAVMEECENVWRTHPGLMLAMYGKGMEHKHWFCYWQGSSIISLRAQAKEKASLEWRDFGQTELRVV